jgi:hypothetical protein
MQEALSHSGWNFEHRPLKILRQVRKGKDKGKSKDGGKGIFFSVQRLIDLARSFIMPVRQLQIDKFRLGLSKWCPRLYASHVGVCEDS